MYPTQAFLLKPASVLMPFHADSPAMVVTQWAETDDKTSILLCETILLAHTVEPILK